MLVAFAVGSFSSREAAAQQGGLTLRARGLGGYTHERPEVLGSEHDVWTAGNPEISYLFIEPRWLLRATYGATLTLHSRNPSELAHRFQLLSSFELTKRSQLFLNGEVRQSSLSTYLFTTPTTNTALVTLARPVVNTNVFTATAGEGLAWEESPVVLLSQSADVAYIKSLEELFPLESFFANVGLAAERLWRNDAVGLDVRAGYAQTEVPPVPSTQFLIGTAAPRWRHDWSQEISSTLSAGASVVTRIDRKADEQIAPFGRAAVLYTVDATSAELSYAGGFAPNLLSGQLLRSHQFTLRGATPLSVRHRVTAAASVGYLRGQVVVLDEAIPSPPPFDAFLSDFDVTWLADDHISLFGRYQFYGQFAGPGASFLREAVIVGVTVSTAPPDGVRIQSQFSQRVDRRETSEWR